MILRSIGVQGWRCFVNPMTVGPFGEAINVIHAPNAVGKSTLLEALVRGFFDGHRVGGRDVEMMRPWGRDLAPEVTLEFTEGSTDYRLRKRFLDNPSSELFRNEGKKFVRFSEGEKADEFVRNLFSGSPPARGLSRPSHWGLAQVLLVPQGELDVPELSGNIVEDIQESLGAQVSGPGTGPLEERIEALYLRCFTPTGKLRAGKDAPRIVELKDRMRDLEAEQRRILELLEVYENVSRRVEDLRARRAQAKRDAQVLEEEMKKARQQAQLYSTLAADRHLRQQQVNAAAARHSEMKQRVDGIESARKDLTAACDELKGLKTDISSRSNELERLKSQAEKTTADLEEVRKGRQQVDEAEKEAEYAQRFVLAGKSLSGIEVLLQKLRETSEDLESRKKELGKAVAPDSKTLKAIRKALTAREEAQVRLDAALITLEIVPHKAGKLEILSAEETGQRQTIPGTPVLVKGAPEVVVDLEGMARICARGPVGTVEELRGDVTKAVRKIDTLTAGFGTADIDELETRSEHVLRIEQKVSAAQTRLETLLSGRTAEEIEQEQEKMKSVLAKIGQEYFGWSDTPPDADALRDNAKTVKQTFISRVQDAELKKENAAQAYQAAHVKFAKIQAEHDLSERRVRTNTEKLEEMQRDGMDDQQRIQTLRQISLEWEASRNALEDVERKLNTFQDDPRLVVEKIEKQLDAIQEQASNLLGQQKNEEGRLEQLASEGPYSVLSQVEEAMADLTSQINGEEVRVNAIRLLRDTVIHCKAKILSDLKRPVEDSATRMLQRIAGSRLGPIELGGGFQPQSVKPRTAGEGVGLTDLSGGEKEQVHLAVRLALAEVLAGADRRFIVLDDILTATDTGRLARILSILEEAAQHLQLFILTCHPERYRGLDQADFFDLEEILNRS